MTDKTKKIIAREGLILLKFIAVAASFAIIGLIMGYASEHLHGIYHEKMGYYAIGIIMLTFIPLYCYPIWLFLRFLVWVIWTLRGRP